MTVFGIKSVIILQKSLRENPSIIKKFLKTKIRFYSDAATEFPLKKDEKCYLKVILKECKYIEKEEKVLFLMT